MASSHQQLKNVISNIEKLVNEALSVKKMKAIGLYAIDLIRIRTRLGYSVAETGAKRTKFKPLMPSTVAIRKAVAKGDPKGIKKAYRSFGIPLPRLLITKLSEETRPSKSNLTFTGQLLDSLSIHSIKEKNVVIGPRGYRDDGKPNELIANLVSKNGRPFNNLSDLELKKVKIFVQDGFTSAIKRRLTN